MRGRATGESYQHFLRSELHGARVFFNLLCLKRCNQCTHQILGTRVLSRGSRQRYRARPNRHRYVGYGKHVARMALERGRAYPVKANRQGWGSVISGALFGRRRRQLSYWANHWPQRRIRHALNCYYLESKKPTSGRIAVF